MNTESYSPFRTVIHATDLYLSECIACWYAAQFSRQMDAKLILFHAYVLSQAAMEAEAISRVSSKQRTKLERLLRESLKQVEKIQSKVKTVLVEGEPVRAARWLSKKYGSSLIVLGAHTRGAIERCIFGSTAEKIVRSIHSPALTIGPRVVCHGDQLAVRRILLATDYSPSATVAAYYAVDLARTFGSEISVLHVASTSTPLYEVNDRLSATTGAIQQAGLRHGDVALKIHPILEYGNPHRGVLRHVREGRYDLIFIGTHLHSTATRHFRTSLLSLLVAEAECPVFTASEATSSNNRSQSASPSEFLWEGPKQVTVLSGAALLRPPLFPITYFRSEGTSSAVR